MSEPTVDILLSTYNGAAFLEEQIVSIQSQTFTQWHLLARDDGSTDGTRDLLRRFAATDRRITLVEDGRGNLGPARSYLALATWSQSSYFMFCDQDDAWHPDKIAMTLDVLRPHDRTPHIAYTDLEVVDPSLSPQHPSFLGLWGHRPGKSTTFSRLLMMNVALGCTQMGNRTLWKCAKLHVPPSGPVYMHDCWLMLIASALGGVSFMPQTTVRYRQHPSNTSGGVGVLGWHRFFRSFSEPGRTPWHRTQWHLAKVAAQARTLLHDFGDQLSPAHRRQAALAGALDSGMGPVRVAQAMACGLTCHSAKLNAAMLAFSFPRVRTSG